MKSEFNIRSFCVSLSLEYYIPKPDHSLFPGKVLKHQKEKVNHSVYNITFIKGFKGATLGSVIIAPSKDRYKIDFIKAGLNFEKLRRNI
jgi:hypothetical protein